MGRADGPLANFTALNAGAALVVGGAVADLAEGVKKAQVILRTGAAADVLERFVSVSQSFAPAGK